MKERLNAKDYAASRNLPVSTVRAYCRNGAIPVLAIGRRYLIDPDIADDFFEHLANEEAEKRQAEAKARQQAKEDERRHRELAAEFKQPGRYLQRLEELRSRTVSQCAARYVSSN